MAWFTLERRGTQWKNGWRGQTISSLSLPPFPLMAIFSIVVLLLLLNGYINYEVQIRRTEIGLRLLLLLLPVVLIFLVRSMVLDCGRYVFRLPRIAEQGSGHLSGSSPWGVAVLVVVLLVMVSYHSSFRSQWFRPLWWSGY